MGLNRMAKNITYDNAEILEDMDELEDYIERLKQSNEVTYDESFHRTVVRKYSELINKIKSSSLSQEDKGFMTETIAELFQEYK